MLKKRKLFSSRWLRNLRFLGICATIIVSCAALYYGIRTNNHNTGTVLKAVVTKPQNPEFLNLQSSVFLNDLPDVNNNRKLFPKKPLRIYYDLVSGPYNPAFKHDLDEHDLEKHVKLVPDMRGKWKLLDSNEIVFTPISDWPTGTDFYVKIDKSLFSGDVKPDKKKIKFSTEPVTTNVDSFNVYPVSDEKKSVIGVAVVSFTEPIQTTDFNDKVILTLDGERVSFDTKFDKYKRTAIIKTAPIPALNEPQSLRLKLNRIESMDGHSKTKKETAKVTIESEDNLFKITDLTTVSADDRHSNPHQLILVNFTAPTNKNIHWKQYLDAYLLPIYATPEEQNNKEPHVWANDEITADIVKKSAKLDLTKVDFVNPVGTHQYAFSYDVSDKIQRYIYVTLKPNILSSNGLIVKNGIAKVLPVAHPDRSVKIAGDGVLLSLAGDKKLSIVARGGAEAAYVNLYKIEENEINHLITQTYNLFSDLEFKEKWLFDAYDMSVVFHKKIPFTDTSMTRVNYAPLNLAEYLDRTHNDKTGLFIIKTGATENETEVSDARLIVLTDLGIIRKINLDKSSTVFVSHLASGKPAADINISVLGRNGYPVWTGSTDTNGRVNIPNFSWEEYKNEKEPVAIIAKHDSDVSFIPYNVDNRQTAEYSKFDVGGVYASSSAPMNAFVFSDRGIYRPGETVVIGTIVKSRHFKALTDVPTKIEITDSRGRVLVDKKISLKSDGMFDTIYKLDTDARLGQYDARVYSLTKQGRVQDILGHASFDVQEFVPDTMKIIATIKDSPQNGWMLPEVITANVSLNNLYGTPAANHKISGTAVLRPYDFTFDEYKDYKFTSNFTSDGTMSNNFTQSNQTFSFKPLDVRTDENGNAALDIHFDQEISIGTYLLTLQINGFESGDGKSIQTVLQTRVSNLKALVGYHSSENLRYIKRNSQRHVKLIALNNLGQPIKLSGAKMRLVKRENLVSLIKDYNNDYKYQTISHDTIISQTPITIQRPGLDLSLDTTQGGTYYLQIIDEENNMLANIEYFVAADTNIEMRQTAQAELQIKLNKDEYTAGEEIEVNITAPYTGSGLITVERDKVYAYKWFNSQTPNSIQKITLPSDFEGTGYINVSFVRDINSQDIFTNPYTYAVAPFKTNINKHKINVQLDAPDLIRTNKLSIKYKTDKDARVMIFAVNSGILQVANYSVPDPIKYFFQKAALQVETHQILSLLLPEYSVLKQIAKTGGGDYSSQGFLDTPLTNPFGRKNLPPVVFYSGIVDTKANVSQDAVFNIPEYFNGALRVYAVAVNTNAVGAANTETKVQTPVIISMSAPTFVAPGDTFNVNAVVSNTMPKSGDAATMFNKVSTSDNLTIKRTDNDTLSIPENTEKLWTFDVLTGENPGVAEINMSSDLLDKNHKRIATRNASTTISVRPATTLTTNIKTGILDQKRTSIKLDKLDMYDAKYDGAVYVSSTPSVLTYPLFMYLKSYDFSCTEQMVSRTLPYVLMPSDKLLGTDYEKSKDYINKTIQTLINRQNDDGSFGLWNSNEESIENLTNETTVYVTAYTMNFLTLARNAGFAVPQNMFGRGIDFLRTYAGQNTISENDANAKAFAIYVLTLNDYVTTSYIELLEEYLNQNVKNWTNKLVGSYIAASYKMLKQNDKAYRLFAEYKSVGSGRFNYESMFNNNVANDAMHIFIGVKYFGKTLGELSPNIENYINSGNYDSFNSGAIIMALVGNTERPTDLSKINIFADNVATTQNTKYGILVSKINNGANKIRIECPKCNENEKLFYTIIRQGFPKVAKSESNGIEISRKYYDLDGNEISSGHIGDIINVKISARTRGTTDNVSNAAITDLLPGGVVPVIDSLEGDMDFSEIHEDR
ncbi:MAG: hypothetical protein K5912_04455, partial [Alphaproteobacteria bacterium]|nr:hypothetical protein [Alphaproteobacteria bacterium]